MADKDDGQNKGESGQPNNPNAMPSPDIPNEPKQTAQVSTSHSQEPGSIIDSHIDRAIEKTHRWPETIMATFTVVIAFVGVVQCHEMNGQLRVMGDQLSDARSSAAAADSAAAIEMGKQQELIAANQTLAGAAADQAKAAKTAAKALSDQVSLMHEEERPWITIEPRIAADVIGTSSGIEVPLNYTVFNVGHLPAFNVQVQDWTLADPRGSLLDMERDKCLGLKPPKIVQFGLGRTLFASQSDPNWDKTGNVGYFARRSSYQDKTGNSVELWVIGCVTYDFGHGGRLHHTGFIKRVIRTFDGPNGPRSTFGINANVVTPKEGLNLIDWQPTMNPLND